MRSFCLSVCDLHSVCRSGSKHISEKEDDTQNRNTYDRQSLKAALNKRMRHNKLSLRQDLVLYIFSRTDHEPLMIPYCAQICVNSCDWAKPSKTASRDTPEFSCDTHALYPALSGSRPMNVLYILVRSSLSSKL